MSAFDDLERLLKSLPPNPVAPENRGLSRLRPSPFVPRGQMLRLTPQPNITGHNRATILMHPVDLVQIVRLFSSGPFARFANIEQEIADIAEQLFAEQEAKGR